MGLPAGSRAAAAVAALHALQPALRRRASRASSSPTGARAGALALSRRPDRPRAPVAVTNLAVVPDPPTASIVIPTRSRPGYLDVALGSASLRRRSAAGAEILVVNDGDDPDGRRSPADTARGVIALRRRAAPTPPATPGIDAARGELIVFIDDDVERPAGWLERCSTAPLRRPTTTCSAARSGPGWRAAARARAAARPPPITTLDLGPADRDAELVWSANMAIRRRAVERVGRFDERSHGPRRRGGLGAPLHRAGRPRALPGRRRARSTAARATTRALRALARAAYGQGRAARRYDVRKGARPALAAELRVAGRLRLARRPPALPQRS